MPGFRGGRILMAGTSRILRLASVCRSMWSANRWINFCLLRLLQRKFTCNSLLANCCLWEALRGRNDSLYCKCRWWPRLDGVSLSLLSRLRWSKRGKCGFYWIPRFGTVHCCVLTTTFEVTVVERMNMSRRVKWHSDEVIEFIHAKWIRADEHLTDQQHMILIGALTSKLHLRLKIFA